MGVPLSRERLSLRHTALCRHSRLKSLFVLCVFCLFVLLYLFKKTVLLLLLLLSYSHLKLCIPEYHIKDMHRLLRAKQGRLCRSGVLRDRNDEEHCDGQLYIYIYIYVYTHIYIYIYIYIYMYKYVYIYIYMGDVLSPPPAFGPPFNIQNFMACRRNNRTCI